MPNISGTLPDGVTIAMATNFTNNTMEDVNMTITTAAPRPQPQGTPYPPGYYYDTMFMLWKVIPPIIIVWGVVGNILTFLVLFRQMRKKVSSTAMYLMALAFSDTIILLCGPLRNFILFIWEEDVRNYTDAGCKAQLYFTYASIHMSSWLLIAVTMERVISVVLPHKVRLGCTPTISGIVIFVIFVSVFGLNMCVPIINGHDTFITRLRCGPTREEYQDFRDDIWNWIDFCVAFAIPFIFLLVGNIVIIYHLYQSHKKQKQMSSTHTSGSKAWSVSVLLVLLCVVFFATMTPVSIFLVYEPYRVEEISKMATYKEAWYAWHYLRFQHAVVNLVGFTNASFNFIMYVLSGSKFRNELKLMICCCKRPFSTGTSTTKTKTTLTTSGTSSVLSKKSVEYKHSVNTNHSGHPKIDSHIDKLSEKDTRTEGHHLANGSMAVGSPPLNTDDDIQLAHENETAMNSLTDSEPEDYENEFEATQTENTYL